MVLTAYGVIIQPTHHGNQWLTGIAYHKRFDPNHSTHLVTPQINVSEHQCFSAVSVARHIVKTQFVEALAAALDRVDVVAGASFVGPQENDYIPAISTLGMTDDSDVRIQPHWWMPNLDRRSIWSGTTILILGGSTHVQEETWLVNGGAQIEYMDIVTRPPANQAAFSKKVAPIRDKAAKARRANKSANATGELLVAFYVYEDLERLEAKWEGNGLAAILLGGLES